VTIDLRT